jgi:hypothetical protein
MNQLQPRSQPQARTTLRAVLDRLSPAAPSGEALADPKEKLDVVERYRQAIDLASARRWGSAIALLQQIVKDDPELTSAWRPRPRRGSTVTTSRWRRTDTSLPPPPTTDRRISPPQRAC